ncbi:MAG: hypothetical protein N2C14_25045, partial [Planctomycetales bacterium]
WKTSGLFGCLTLGMFLAFTVIPEARGDDLLCSFTSDETVFENATSSCDCEPPHRNHASRRSGCGSSRCCEHSSSRFRLSEINIYPTFSYLGSQEASYTEFEFASHTDLGFLEMENRTVMNVADLPSTIKLGPANQGGSPTTADVRGNGFGDTLSGFFFSTKCKERNYHLGIGPVITLPSASNDILGSDQWTLGPGAHFSTEIGKLSAGFFVWQSWKVGGSDAQKRTNQLFGKPFFIYELTENWHLVSMPLGLSHSWESPSGDDWTVPVGGGVRRLFETGGGKIGIQMQAFDYVARKPQDPEWELRFTIELLFDE